MHHEYVAQNARLHTYNSFIIFIRAGIDANDHSHFAFTVKIVLEQMCET